MLFPRLWVNASLFQGSISLVYIAQLWPSMGSSSFIKIPAGHDSRRSGGVHPYDMSCQAETSLRSCLGWSWLREGRARALGHQHVHRGLVAHQEVRFPWGCLQRAAGQRDTAVAAFSLLRSVWQLVLRIGQTCQQSWRVQTLPLTVLKKNNLAERVPGVWCGRKVEKKEKTFAKDTSWKHHRIFAISRIVRWRVNIRPRRCHANRIFRKCSRS